MVERIAPRQGIDLVGADRKCTQEWFRFFENLKERQDNADALFASLSNQVLEYQQRIEDLESTTAHLMMAQGQSDDFPTPATTDTPIGAMLLFGSTTIPTGFLDCDGSAISRVMYAQLFNAIGTAFGPGDGSTTFNLPDAPGNFFRGSGGGTGINIGDTGGAASVDLTHNHDVTVPSVEVQSGTGTMVGQTGTFTSTNGLSGVDTTPPWIGCKFIIRYA